MGAIGTFSVSCTWVTRPIQINDQTLSFIKPSNTFDTWSFYLYWNPLWHCTAFSVLMEMLCILMQKKAKHSCTAVFLYTKIWHSNLKMVFRICPTIWHQWILFGSYYFSWFIIIFNLNTLSINTLGWTYRAYFQINPFSNLLFLLRMFLWAVSVKWLIPSV